MTDNLTEFALPGVLGEIARLTSVETAIGVARRVGGDEIYIPHTLPRKHKLVSLVGRQCALILCDRYGGEHLEFPSAKTHLRWYDARQLKRAGKSTATIAHHLGIGKRRVEQLTQGMDLSDRSEASPPSEFQAKACPACGRRSCKPKAHGPLDLRQGDLFLTPQSFGSD